jgi:hypothetical protein
MAILTDMKKAMDQIASNGFYAIAVLSAMP